MKIGVKHWYQKWFVSEKQRETAPSHLSQEQEESLELLPETIGLERLLQRTIPKNAFQFFFAPDYQQIYLLLRDTQGARLGVESKVPLIILDEKRLSQLIYVLQRMVKGMRAGQVLVDRASEDLHLLTCSPPDLYTGETPLPEDASEGWQPFSPASASALFLSEQLPEEGEEEEGCGEESNEGGWDDAETDDGMGYPRYS